MQYKTKNIYLILMLLLLSLTVAAQKINVHGPSRVAAGQQFELQYVVNTTDVKGFRMGTVPDAFEVLYGPSTSTQMSYSSVNGHTTQTSSVAYTYILMARKNGTFVIPAATAVVAGTKQASPALRINVSGNAQQANPQQGGGAHQQPARMRQQSVRGNELFIKVSANKQRVVEQQPVLLTYKVYTNLELTQLEGKMPDLNGFHTQEIPLPRQKSFHIETLDGKPYRCVTWSQYVLFPQMSGKMEVPSITFRGIVMQEDPNVDPFEAYFNGGSGYIEVKREIKAPAVQLTVDPLPAKPANFSGGVGSFSISADLDKKTVKAGDPVNVKIVVSGVGNLKLIKQPELSLPSDFDKYDPKVTDKTKLTAEGLTGSMTYDMLIVPRNQGDYTIPEMEFVYYDTKSSSYKTLRTKSMSLHVEKGKGGGASVTDYSQVNDNDIHDIKPGDANIENAEHTFFGSGAYLTLNLIIMAILAATVLFLRRRMMLMSDTVAMKGRKANKVAVKRLKVANKMMAEGKQAAFYDEVLRTLWGYVGDKLSMPVEQLSRDNISENLGLRSVDHEVIRQFIEAIDECEYARYAPASEGATPLDIMQNTYNKALDAITSIEEGMKTRKSGSVGSLLLFIAFLLCGTMTAMAADGNHDKANADAAYHAGEYQKALQMYEQQLTAGPSSEIYYNLGNTYYRMNQIPQAVLAYERALRMAPGDKDIMHNIDIVRGKTIDKLPPTSELFFVTWVKSFVFGLSADGWAILALISLIVASMSLLAFFFMDNIAVRRASFYACMTLFVVYLISNIMAWQHKKMLTVRDAAIVMRDKVSVMSTPETKGSEACIIHEGTKVEITDTDMKGWYGIRLSDGREGWIQSTDVELI